MQTDAGRPKQHTSVKTEGPESTSDALRSALAALLVFVLSVAVYAPAFEGPFVWDDELLISRDEVATLQPLPTYFSRAYWLATDTQAAPSYYRPLTLLSLAVDHAVHRGNPAGFHLTNLLLHGLNAVLVLALGRRLGAGLPSALVAALLFAWFPRLSEAVAWISGRTDLLAAFFSLLALLVALGKRRERTWFASVLLLLAISSKEVALAAALAIGWYTWREGRANPPRQQLSALLPLLLAGLLYAGLRLSVLGPVPGTGDVTIFQRLVAPLEAIGRYAVMVVDGWNPRLNIGHLSFPDWRYATFGGVVAGAVGIAAFRSKPRPEQALLFITGSLGIGLVIHLLPYQSSVSAADRYLYLPLGACLPLAACRMSRAGSPVGLGALLALALSYLPFTWQRAKVWGDDILFWGTAVHEQDLQLNAMSHTGLASMLVRHGMYEEALVVYERIQPGDRATFLVAAEQHATVLALNGETDRALHVLERAAAAQPSPRLFKTLALSYAGAGKKEDARKAAKDFESRVQDRQAARELWQRLAAAERAQKTLGDRVAQTAHRAPPADVQQRLAGARWLHEVGRSRVAMSEFMAAVDDPGMTSHELRAILVFSLSYGTPRQVNRVYQRLLTLDPSTPAEFSLLVTERNHRVERLRHLCRELRIPVPD